MERWNLLPVWIRIALVGAVSFALGAIVAFGYSYRPLHGALAWKVEQLESRLDARNLENLKMADELAALRKIEEERIDPATLAQVRAELDQTKYALGTAESKLERLDRRHRDAVAGSNRWRKRYEKLRDSAPSRTLPASPTPREDANGHDPSPDSAPLLSNTPDASSEPLDSSPEAAPLSGPSMDGLQPSSDTNALPATLSGEATEAP